MRSIIKMSTDELMHYVVSKLRDEGKLPRTPVNVEIENTVWVFEYETPASTSLYDELDGYVQPRAVIADVNHKLWLIKQVVVHTRQFGDTNA